MKKKPKRQARGLTKKEIQRLLGMIFAAIMSFYLWLSGIITTAELPDDTQLLRFYSTEMRDDLTIAFTEAISSAEKSVTLLIYSLTDQKILHALNNKSMSGCQVKVICDAKTSNNIEERLHGKIELIKRFTPGLMHQKILIIDNKTTWIGSANMTRESLRHHGNLVTAINSTALATLAHTKAQSLQPSDRLLLLPHHSFTIDKQHIELSFLPDDQHAVERLTTLIRGAQKSIRVAMFTWTHQGLANEVIKAKQRGIDVQVVVDSSSAVGASKKVVSILKRHAVPTTLSRGNALLHHKFMYVDGHTLVHGSANWTLSAFAKNDDCFLIMHPLTSGQKQFMDRLWSRIK